MKYFAILKDSLREARDSTALYVLFGLSTLAIVVVAMLSFTPMTAEDTMQQFFSHRMEEALNARKPEKMESRGMRFRRVDNTNRLLNVKLLSGTPDSPESEYELTVVHELHHRDDVPFDVKAMAPGNPPAVGKAPEPVKKNENQREAIKSIRKIFADAEELGYVRIGEITVAEQKEQDAVGGGGIVCLVKVQGTPLTYRIWASKPNFLVFPVGGSGPLGYQVYYLASLVLSIGAWVAVLTGVVITSFFIPNMLQKGTVDFLLVKPIHRWVLLVYKYIGGLTFIFLSTVYAVGGIWLVLGIRTGLWANGALLLIFTITFFFAILYAISTLIGVVTRSTVTAIMLTIAAWFAFFVVGTAYSAFDVISRIEKAMADANQPVPEDERWGSGTTAMVVRVIHAVSPRTGDLNSLNDLIVYTDFMTGNLANASKFDTSSIVWWESLLVSALWIAIVLGLASLWFTYKDY